jgi:hypothetical protein
MQTDHSIPTLHNEKKDNLISSDVYIYDSLMIKKKKQFIPKDEVILITLRELLIKYFRLSEESLEACKIFIIISKDNRNTIEQVTIYYLDITLISITY